MLQVSPLGDVFVVSVHDEEEPIHFSIPNVIPSRYEIPGINALKDTFNICEFSFPGEKPIRYAFRRTKNNKPYVMVKIVESRTFIHGTEQQKTDEYGQKLSPDVLRVPVPIRQESIANEIERAFGIMGLVAGRGEVTEEMIDAAMKKNVEFMKKSVVEANKNYKRPGGSLQITSQVRRRAWRLHKLGLLSPLPEWADMNPEAKSAETDDSFNCRNCGKILRFGTAVCDACHAVADWKRAVDLGLIKPADVPPWKRKEAGLDLGAPTPQPSSSGADDDEDSVNTLLAAAEPMDGEPVIEDEDESLQEGDTDEHEKV